MWQVTSADPAARDFGILHDWGGILF